MLSSAFLGLALATTVSAAPFHGLNSTKWTPSTSFSRKRSSSTVKAANTDKITVEVVHESVYHSLIASDGISEDIPEVPEAFPAPSHPFKAPKSSNDSSLSKRQCDLTTAVVTDRSETFVDWDVQMSPVIIGTGDGITVSVTSGYSVSNSVSVSGGADWTVVKDKLGLSFGVDYSRTWTSSASINIAAKVADGYSGVMITKPIKTRKYGRVLKGCIGSQTESGTFSADSFEEKEYAGIKWVSGAITLCSKKEFPLSRCTGSGNFV